MSSLSLAAMRAFHLLFSYIRPLACLQLQKATHTSLNIETWSSEKEMLLSFSNVLQNSWLTNQYRSKYASTQLKGCLEISICTENLPLKSTVRIKDCEHGTENHLPTTYEPTDTGIRMYICATGGKRPTCLLNKCPGSVSKFVMMHFSISNTHQVRPWYLLGLYTIVIVSFQIHQFLLQA